ncbi:hypothetical protein EI42_03227 [Thermosporothrix hazakensis]|jgi:hypothetical protein|uniref:Uncharacterized protein n=2 Tax=Thermosporothrix TaxID=768650 RepID=A0A326U5C4_THEHA|nr:hypothetical protein EI42_03227 [Thermosporothrix hazakensis]BBH86336.1 hypothetical protein KTC_10870 [Thermosporothrix sp. COM3]GCE45250.1 hypothetical protein KTH_01190 [Thermosporothrix hazakensis]
MLSFFQDSDRAEKPALPATSIDSLENRAMVRDGRMFKEAGLQDSSDQPFS